MPAVPPRYIGRYQLERRLGGGGMAEVFAARTPGVEGFSRRVAIKRVLPAFAHDPQFSSLFVAEAHVLARLSHPNVVSVLDFERDPKHGLFLVLELVDGPDLARLLATGLLPIPVSVFLACEVLRGLAYAHRQAPHDSDTGGVVHRDISPQNVLLSWEGAVKVSDFGIAKLHAASRASASSVVKGKPAYMSPEQANGRPLDGRADLFSVGVMLWEMMTGRHLFPGETVQETLASLFFGPISSPRAYRPEVSADLAAVTLRLLERTAARRYANADDALAALLACSAAPRDGRGALRDLLHERRAALAARGPTEPAPAPVRVPSAKEPARATGITVAGRRLAASPPALPAGASPARLGRQATLGRWRRLIAIALLVLGAARPARQAVPTAPAAPPTPAPRSPTSEVTWPRRPAAPQQAATRRAATPPAATPFAPRTHDARRQREADGAPADEGIERAAAGTSQVGSPAATLEPPPHKAATAGSLRPASPRTRRGRRPPVGASPSATGIVDLVLEHAPAPAPDDALAAPLATKAAHGDVTSHKTPDETGR